MGWRELVAKVYAEGDRGVTVGFRPGATVEQMASLEGEVGLRIPTPLRELLTESDGVVELLHRGDTPSVFHWPVWSCDKMIEQNRRARAELKASQEPPGAPEAKPFFFASAGVEGILFAFLVRSSGPEDPAVYGYYPMGYEWHRISPSLEAHFKDWTV